MRFRRAHILQLQCQRERRVQRGHGGAGSRFHRHVQQRNLIYQLSSTPGIGPGDVLLSYAVTASPGIKLTGIDLTNDAIMGPVVIGEVACRVMFSPSGTCAPADRLATLIASTGQSMNAFFANPVDFVFLHKDIDIGIGGFIGGFISDFSNSHDISPTPEPATLLLLGSTLTGMGLAWRRRGTRLGKHRPDRLSPTSAEPSRRSCGVHFPSHKTSENALPRVASSVCRLSISI